MQVHKETIDKVPNSMPNRSNVDIEIYGMEGKFIFNYLKINVLYTKCTSLRSDISVNVPLYVTQNVFCLCPRNSS